MWGEGNRGRWDKGYQHSLIEVTCPIVPQHGGTIIVHKNALYEDLERGAGRLQTYRRDKETEAMA